MRYNIGEKVIAVLYVMQDRTPWVNPQFRPWEDNLKQMNFKVLTVTEHHKVAWDQDPAREQKYDGFVLQDRDGQQWGNQFPSASYGQTTTAANYYFERIHPKGTKYDELTDEQMACYEDVTTVIDRVVRGIEYLAKHDEDDKANLLKIHLEWLYKKIERETGATVVFEPIWKEHPDITRSVLVWEE